MSAAERLAFLREHAADRRELQVPKFTGTERHGKQKRKDKKKMLNLSMCNARGVCAMMCGGDPSQPTSIHPITPPPDGTFTSASLKIVAANFKQLVKPFSKLARQRTESAAPSIAAPIKPRPASPQTSPVTLLDSDPAKKNQSQRGYTPKTEGHRYPSASTGRNPTGQGHGQCSKSSSIRRRKRRSILRNFKHRGHHRGNSADEEPQRPAKTNC